MSEDRIPTMPQESAGGEGRIPTMPQESAGGEGRIPTMPQESASGEGRIPTMPQESAGGEGRIPTMPQESAGGEGRISTMPQNVVGTDGRVATIPQGGEYYSGVSREKLMLTSRTTFISDRGEHFVIDGSHVISANSGESQIFGCCKSDSNEKLVARVLISTTPRSDEKKKKTRRKVIDFLERVSIRDDSHILPLIDYGTINIKGEDYYVEIYPLCESGDLERRKGQISFKELCDEIIPAINHALKLFHDEGLVHRDIKPDNLYKYKGKVVIGDFGITCDLNEEGFATDKQKTGTLGYYSPELMSQAAIKASDYYSFGQTLWTLYSGDMMYKNILRFMDSDVEKRNQINHAMMNGLYYGLDEISAEESFFEILIRGLLQYAPTQRFDYDKVERWLSGDKSLYREILDYKGKITFTREFPLCGKKCWDDDDVFEALSSHWDEALDVLYSGVLKNFYSSQDFEHTEFLSDIMSRYSKSSNGNSVPLNNSIGLSKTLLYLSKNKKLSWHGKTYEKLSDISEALEEYFSDGAKYGDFRGLILSKLIGEWYQSMSGKQEDIKEPLDAMEKMMMTRKEGEETVYYWLYYMLVGDPTKVQIDGCSNLNDLVHKLLSKKTAIYGDGREKLIIDDTSFLGLLCVWGYDETVKIFLDSLDEKYVFRYDMFFDFLEREMESEKDKLLVRNFYCECGPNGYLTWWKRNLDLYSYFGENSNTLKRSIEEVKLDGKAHLSLQRTTFERLKAMSKQFKNKIEADLFLGHIGIQCLSEDYIFSERLSCAWKYEFMGETAPIGFKFFMESSEENI